MNGGPPAGDVGLPALGAAGYEDSPAGAGAAGVARTWWDANADEYQAEHGDALGDADFVWGPEGLREADAHLLGDLDDLARARVLEVGAGAAQCSRWLRGQGVDVVATDLSGGMLATGRALDTATGVVVPLVQADARALPFANASFDVVFTSYGVIPFVPDARTVHREVARVLRPGGRWVFSTSHPVRWAFPDDPGPDGLVATRSYFDARAYVERADDGSPLYAEFHRALATHVADVVACGFVVDALTEPEWSPGRGTWGGWSAQRGAVLPGTLVLGCRLAG